MSAAKAMLSSEEIKPVALSIVGICLAGGISQANNQSVKKYRNLFEGVKVTLKEFMDLVMAAKLL